MDDSYETAFELRARGLQCDISFWRLTEADSSDLAEGYDWTAAAWIRLPLTESQQQDSTRMTWMTAARIGPSTTQIQW